ncbi:hyaluronidase-1 [Microcaecilia unicolor]|uniref:Hyaluronidase n=1 Tax=Microcaecilia unicolor TaxID=1415580 RepID=A0A6P7YJJ4_9AMPH|nr:hyaluronidase-1-like [Microcaecilia unicolor]
MLSEISSGKVMIFLAFLMGLSLSPCSACLARPVHLNLPFVTIWNAPTQHCQDRYQVDLDLRVFDIVRNKNQSFIGKEVTIFYNTDLGFYPYYTENGTAVNGGIPQNASLKDHLSKAKENIEAAILNSDFQGVAVIDWENWRPLWVRNWDKMKIYIDKSIELVKDQHPDWPLDLVTWEAKHEFEQAGRDFMEETLKLTKRLRPMGLWGFYGFPNCYNFEYKNASVNYTGECPKITMQRNDELQWLWNQSRALYPQIYLEKELKMSDNALKFVRHRVQEAFRVAQQTVNGSLPILPYARIVYAFTMDFLAEEDLVHTIGESAARGASGIILWGNKDYSESQESCLAVKGYIDRTLGQYIINVTKSTVLCSHVLCSGNGRCVRKEHVSRAYLHLNPMSFRIKKDPDGLDYILQGELAKEDIAKMADDFRCQCYCGWEGTDCKVKTSLYSVLKDPPNVGSYDFFP